MKNYIIVNKITKDIEGIPSTTEEWSIQPKDSQDIYEVDLDIKNLIRQAKFGSYFENGIVVPKPMENTPYDTWDYTTKTWITDLQEQLVGEDREVRNTRNSLLSEMDIIISNPIRWASMTSEKQAEWIQYRQLLLDIPQQVGFPLNVVFPTTPTE